MKIHLNNVSINLELSEFMEILEANAFDELLVMIIELDEAYLPAPKLDVKKNPAPPQDLMIFEDDLDIDFLYDEHDCDHDHEMEFDPDDKQGVLDLIADMLEGNGDFEISIYQVEPGMDLDIDEDFYPSYDMSGAYYYSDEDERVNRIVNRFRGLVE